MPVPVDRVTLEAVDQNGSVFDAWTSFELRNTMIGGSHASFEVGDAGTYNALEELTRLGSRFKVYVNDKPRLGGKVHTRQSPADAFRASVVQFIVRTFLSEAMVVSADPAVRVEETSIKDFILAVYRTIGATESDFVFEADVARDLITGRATKGGRSPTDLEPIKVDQARVRAPETVHAAVDRHLRRHGFMHWDGPDGKIVVGEPDDEQDPLYYLRLLRGEGAQNNVLSVNRTQDIGTAATLLGVFGQGGGTEFSKAQFQSVEANEDLTNLGFIRPVLIIDESIRTEELAARRARREMGQRSRSLDSWQIEADGLSFRDGREFIPYAPDTVCDILVETHGGAVGRYYVEATQLRLDPHMGAKSSLTIVPPGSWRL